MGKLIIGLSIGLLVGASLAVLLPNMNRPDVLTRDESSSTREIFSKIESLNVPQAENITAKPAKAVYQSLKEILKLKSEFNQTEALYELAASASPKQLIQLIREASVFNDASDRRGALSILFSRLTDLAPSLSLELSRDPMFAHNESVYRSVWRSWARSDFDKALSVLMDLPSARERNQAIQAVYWAVDVFGNDKADTVQRVTGVGPSRWAVAKKLEERARDSVPQAIETMNELESLGLQKYVVKSIAKVAVNIELDAALFYESLVVHQDVKRIYRNSVSKAIGEISPERSLDNWVANQFESDQIQQVYAALSELVQTDFELAKSYIDQAPNSRQKKDLVMIVLAARSSSSAVDALALAHQYQADGLSDVLARLVQQMVAKDPKATLEALELSPGLPSLENLMITAIASLAQADLAYGFEKVDTFSDPSLKARAIGFLLGKWSKTDPNAAVSYALEQSDLNLDLIKGYQINLDGADLDLAMKLLNRSSKQERGSMAFRVLSSLGQERGTQELIAELAPYRDTPGFAVLKQHLLDRMARREEPGIERFIEQYWEPGSDKSYAYLSLAEQIAKDDPGRALALYDKIDDVDYRSLFASAVLPRQKDLNLVKDWISNLSDASIKDEAIFNLSSRLDINRKSDLRMFEQIQNVEKRDLAISKALLKTFADDAGAMEERARELRVSEASIRNLIKCAKPPSDYYLLRPSCYQISNQY